MPTMSSLSISTLRAPPSLEHEPTTAKTTQAPIDPKGIALAEAERISEILQDILDDIGAAQDPALMPHIQNLAAELWEFGHNLRLMADALYILYGSYPRYLPSASAILPQVQSNISFSVDRVKSICADDALPRALYGSGGPFLLSLRTLLGISSPYLRLWHHLRRLPAMVESMQFVMATTGMLVAEMEGPEFKARAGDFLWRFSYRLSNASIRVRRMGEKLFKATQQPSRYLGI
ncbi:hypothetical protein C8R46DRAFT_1296325 [Mycena filopes]|nr:hypothetical protein C8R46DRAFT_1296325 [Mycena filopes]